MPKRLQKRNKSTAPRGAAARADRDQPSSGAERGKSRADGPVKKCARFAALMFLPVLFGVAGLIMFPPSLTQTNDTRSAIERQNISLDSQNVANVANATNQNATLKMATAGKVRRSQSDDQNVDNINSNNMGERTKMGKVPKEKRGRAHSKSESPSRPKRDTKQQGKETKIMSEARNFKPTILDSLDIRHAGISVEGRNIVPIELTSDKPDSPVKVYQFEGFLTDRECEGLMRVHRRHISETGAQDPVICFDTLATLKSHLRDMGMNREVTHNVFTEGTTCINATFSKELEPHLTWSYSTAFYPAENKFSTIFEDRVYEATGLRQANGGKFQITSYPKGIGYKTHTDCIPDNEDKRDRFGTILVYLQDVEEGGETKFPELGVSVQPRKGRAIVWNNMNSRGRCEPTSVHEAAAVKTGHKFILQRWYYYENFYQLGKRAQEPLLPARAPGQPRVTCDEYEHGSCRWYDEWNYEHLIDYVAQRSELY